MALIKPEVNHWYTSLAGRQLIRSYLTATEIQQLQPDSAGQLVQIVKLSAAWEHAHLSGWILVSGTDQGERLEIQA